MNEFQSLLKGQGQRILNEAGDAAKQYLGNMINEMLFVKKDADVSRNLPTLRNMKVLNASQSYASAANVQDYNLIKQQCLASGRLFEDSDFLPNDTSLMFSKRPDRRIEWKRPHEIVQDPYFFHEGFSRFDIEQGELGDCWFLAAAANLTMYPNLFARVVPDDQTFEDSYAGIFHFRFWQYGKWVDIVIDDLLPTSRGELIYMHSPEKREFWSALLEKAYAKLHGSYEALKGGTTCEAMEDFTGGVIEMYELKEAPQNLFQILQKAYERNSMIACSIEPDPNVLEAETPQGLVRGHAYSITKVELLDINTPNSSGKIPMVRLRNPWGNETEWNGQWSDKSPEWNYIPDYEKQKIGLVFDRDGEFWMSFRDFCHHYDRVELCNLSPDSLTEDDIQRGKKRWEMSEYEGAWIPGVSAGGCRNFLDSFWKNPQYVIQLNDPDDDDDELCTVIIGLMQKNRRSRSHEGVECIAIGYAVYKVTEYDLQDKPLRLQFFAKKSSTARSAAFINLREVSTRHKLPPGHYVIVPSTFEPNEEGEFLLRVFSECKIGMQENDDGGNNLTSDSVGWIEPGKQPYVPQPSMPEYRTSDPLEQMFTNMVGASGEIDQFGLKQILDALMSQFFPPKGSSGAPQIIDDVPGGPRQTDEEGQGCGSAAAIAAAIGALICGLLQQKDGGGQGGQQAQGFNLQQVLQQFIEPPQQQARQTVQYAEIPPYPVPQYPPEVCYALIIMFDSNRSGRCSLEDFRRLMMEMQKWRQIFGVYDPLNIGRIQDTDLKPALSTIGYHLNQHVLFALQQRYTGHDRLITFDAFTMSIAKTHQLIESFKDNPEGMANVNVEQWLQH